MIQDKQDHFVIHMYLKSVVFPPELNEKACEMHCQNHDINVGLIKNRIYELHQCMPY